MHAGLCPRIADTTCSDTAGRGVSTAVGDTKQIILCRGRGNRGLTHGRGESCRWSRIDCFARPQVQKVLHPAPAPIPLPTEPCRRGAHWAGLSRASSLIPAATGCSVILHPSLPALLEARPVLRGLLLF